MSELFESLAEYLPYVWILTAIVLALKAQITRKTLLVVGFLAIGINGLGWQYYRSLPEEEYYDEYLDEYSYERESDWPDVSPWILFGGIGCILVGVFRVGGGGGRALASAIEAVNQYFQTDELVARHSTMTPANDDVESLRQSCHEFFKTIASRAPDRTIIVDPGKYSRRILIERLDQFGHFDTTQCGQLRSAEVIIAGPGDALPWMTVTVNYQAEHQQIMTQTISNRDVAKYRSLLQHPVIIHLDRFITTGKIRKPILRQIGLMVVSALRSLLIPIHLVILAVGLPVLILRGIVALFRGRVQTRFVASKQPERLPPETFNVPNGYWYVLLEGQAEKLDELRKEITSKLKKRASQDTIMFDQDVTRWGGFNLKESRTQTVIEFRRCRVIVGLYRYGSDLYVRWESHINGITWSLMRFPYSTCAGFRFGKGEFAWADPLFTQCPSIFDFAPQFTPVTEFDWADVDSIEALVHDETTTAVRAFRERHKIDKEIDYELKKGLTNPERGPAAETPPAKGGGALNRVKSWARGFQRKS